MRSCIVYFFLEKNWDEQMAYDWTLVLFVCFEEQPGLFAHAWITSLITLLLLFQFQTMAQETCYRRPPGGILTPGESLIATSNCF